LRSKPMDIAGQTSLHHPLGIQETLFAGTPEGHSVRDPSKNFSQHTSEVKPSSHSHSLISDL
ncbi:hypothetical protein ACPXAZ_25550, partial [Escherichia coli]|uniref:hypothetical protein n=1 Tax=Escherichia coli TaxID=562 RepID=UPI003CE45DF2